MHLCMFICVPILYTYFSTGEGDSGLHGGLRLCSSVL